MSLDFHEPSDFASSMLGRLQSQYFIARASLAVIFFTPHLYHFISRPIWPEQNFLGFWREASGRFNFIYASSARLLLCLCLFLFSRECNCLIAWLI